MCFHPASHSNRGIALLFAFLLSIAGPPVLAANLFVIIATDDRAPAIGEDMATNSKSMVRTIKQNVPRSRSQILKIQPAFMTPAAILGTIRSIEAAADDAILFYYSGHGGYDETRQQTWLLLSQSPGTALFLGQIRQEIAAKNVRLGTIVVDCCSQLPPMLARGPIAPPEMADQGTQQVSRLFQKLFFDQAGSVIVESSAPKEYAIVVPPLRYRDGRGILRAHHFGALFTQSFTEAMSFDDLDEANIGWTQLCQQTQNSIDNRFGGYCPGGVITLGTGEQIPQSGQTVTAWINDQPMQLRRQR
jgi:hypothetical protein